jgi:hypothetical protein
MDITFTDSRDQEQWWDVTVVGFSRKSQKDNDCKTAIRDISTIIGAPTTRLKLTSRAMLAATNAKIKKHALIKLLAQRQRTTALRSSAPTFGAATFSAGAVFDTGTMDLISSLAVAYFQKFRRQ